MYSKASKALIVLMLLATLTVGFAPVQASPANAGNVVHVVRWGENLASIAARYGVTAAAIVQANGLRNADFIYAGQTLVIPVAGQPTTPPAGGNYMVRTGDSLMGIAARYGTTVSAIMAANGLKNANFIFVGQWLKIPGAGTSPAPAPAPQPGNTSYRVQWGDTLSAIAFRFGTTIAAIMQANGLGSSWAIYAGQVLLIPGSAPAPSPNPIPGSYYTVCRGDTLTRIAIRFGTTTWALMQANNLANASLIYVGQRLVIPGRAKPPKQPPAVNPPVVPPYSPCPPYTPPCPGATPAPSGNWVGYLKSSDCTNTDTNALRSVIRVSVVGLKGLPVTVSAGTFTATGITGTKPEYGEFTVEFAPFNQGLFTITPAGLGTSLQVRVDGTCTAWVEFAQR